MQCLNRTVLYLAVENENTEIIQLFLACDKIDPNIMNIIILIFLFNLKIKHLIAFQI